MAYLLYKVEQSAVILYDYSDTTYAQGCFINLVCVFADTARYQTYFEVRCDYGCMWLYGQRRCVVFSDKRFALGGEITIIHSCISYTQPINVHIAHCSNCHTRIQSPPSLCLSVCLVMLYLLKALT